MPLYTTTDHDSRAQDILVDTCEDYLTTDRRVAAKVRPPRHQRDEL